MVCESAFTPLCNEGSAIDILPCKTFEESIRIILDVVNSDLHEVG